jgi:hypothetical protein
MKPSLQEMHGSFLEPQGWWAAQISEPDWEASKHTVPCLLPPPCSRYLHVSTAHALTDLPLHGSLCLMDLPHLTRPSPWELGHLRGTCESQARMCHQRAFQLRVRSQHPAERVSPSMHSWPDRMTTSLGSIFFMRSIHHIHIRCDN